MAKRHFTDLECRDTVYITPDYLLAPVRKYFGGQIPLDPATEPTNPTGASTFCIAPDRAGASPLHQLAVTADGSNCLIDGLSVAWSNFPGVFLNPPYGKVIQDWCRKIYQETILGATTLSLLPAGARFSTRYFQEYIFNPGLDVALFVRGRVQFHRPDGSVAKGNPYDSVIYGHNVDLDLFVECFADQEKPDGKPLGKIIRMEVM
jgi:hypothetical protein